MPSFVNLIIFLSVILVALYLLQAYCVKWLSKLNRSLEEKKAGKKWDDIVEELKNRK